MKYPDFAFYTITQIILFLVNCTVTTMSYYWGANLILQLYQKRVSFRQKLLFSFMSAMLLNILVIYAISLVNGIVNQKGQLYIGIFANITKVMLPFSYFILYQLGVRVLKLSNFKSVKIMQLSYVYFASCGIVLKIAGFLIFPRIADPRGWNYLRDILMLISGAGIIYIFYRLISYTVNKYKLSVEFFDNIVVGSLRHELAKNFGICSLSYVLITISYYYTKLDGIHAIFMFCICLSYLIVSITYDYLKISNRKITNKDEHITILNQSIDEFRGIKHDFNNILQTYSGYLAIRDMDGLTKYHKKVTNTAVSAGLNLDLSQRISENPPFFSLIMNKLDRAKKEEVAIQLVLACNMEEIFIDELDFNCIMAILLDNAIEAAVLTPTRRISLTSQMKPDGSKLFILSNDTFKDVETENLFRSGFTTKSGHMGQGLTQVRTILHKYGNCILNMSCFKGNFTVYLEIKANAQAKVANNKVGEIDEQPFFEQKVIYDTEEI